MNLVDFHKVLVFNEVIIVAPTPAPAVAGVAPFFDFDEYHLKG
jgi:hypothetical protein